MNDALRKGVSARSPHAIDAYVGERLRLRRTLLGMSQEALGDELNLSFQQVQKYERGTNRISASRLYELGRILEVQVSYFYEGMTDDVIGGQRPSDNDHNHDTPDGQDPFAKRETLELVRSYYKISRPIVRRRVYALVKALSGSDTDESAEALDSPGL